MLDIIQKDYLQVQNLKSNIYLWEKNLKDLVLLMGSLDKRNKVFRQQKNIFMEVGNKKMNKSHKHRKYY